MLQILGCKIQVLEDLDSYEKLMSLKKNFIILATASLIVSILRFTHKK